MEALVEELRLQLELQAAESVRWMSSSWRRSGSAASEMQLPEVEHASVQSDGLIERAVGLGVTRVFLLLDGWLVQLHTTYRRYIERL